MYRPNEPPLAAARPRGYELKETVLPAGRPRLRLHRRCEAVSSARRWEAQPFSGVDKHRRGRCSCFPPIPRDLVSFPFLDEACVRLLGPPSAGCAAVFAEAADPPIPAFPALTVSAYSNPLPATR